MADASDELKEAADAVDELEERAEKAEADAEAAKNRLEQQDAQRRLDEYTRIHTEDAEGSAREGDLGML